MDEILHRLYRLEVVVSRMRVPVPVEYFDNDQAAEFLGLKPSTLEIWRCRGEGPHFIRVGRKIMYSVEDLRQYMAERRTSPLAGSQSNAAASR